MLRNLDAVSELPFSSDDISAFTGLFVTSPPRTPALFDFEGLVTILHPDNSLNGSGGKMALRKQAKYLSKTHIQILLGYLDNSRLPLRNRVICLLSVRAGLRAREIAFLTWGMVLNPVGQIDEFIRLEDSASKRKSGRVIPISSELREALTALRAIRPLGHDARVIYTERQDRTTPQVIVNLFARWFDDCCFKGCSSHSGRRTFITNAARKISTVGGSLRDVQMLAGHSSLRITQSYIDGEQEAQKRIVELV